VELGEEGKHLQVKEASLVDASWGCGPTLLLPLW